MHYSIQAFNINIKAHKSDVKDIISEEYIMNQKIYSKKRPFKAAFIIILQYLFIQIL